MNRGILDGAVHSFHLAVGPGMVGLGQAMFNGGKKANPVEGMSPPASRRPLTILGKVGELDSVIGEHGVDAIGDRCDQRSKKAGSGSHVGTLDQLDKGELRGSVNCHEEVELGFGSPYFSQIDMEETDGIAIKPLGFRLAAFDLRQAADSMTKKATMQGRAGQMRDGGPQSVETVIQRKQGLPAEGYDDDGKHGESGALRVHSL
jgi:hypothetical protein